jgi:hypothetical protein
VALRNWWTENFNDFERPVTNGYAEAANTLAKGFDRMGRGYSCDAIRARLLFDSDACKDARGPLREKMRRSVAPGTNPAFVTGIASPWETASSFEARTVEYGPFIRALVSKLEAGEIDWRCGSPYPTLAAGAVGPPMGPRAPVLAAPAGHNRTWRPPSLATDREIL